MNLRAAWILGLWAALFSVVGVAAWFGQGRMREELRAAQERERRIAVEVEHLEARVQDQASTLERLRNDPVFVERTVRQRLNYVKPGEVVFRFRDE